MHTLPLGQTFALCSLPYTYVICLLACIIFIDGFVGYFTSELQLHSSMDIEDVGPIKKYVSIDYIRGILKVILRWETKMYSALQKLYTE